MTEPDFLGKLLFLFEQEAPKITKCKGFSNISKEKSLVLQDITGNEKRDISLQWKNFCF